MSAEQAALEVLRSGPQSLFQDLGRPGLASMGVGRSGAADRASLHAVNALLGNDSGCAVIESVLGGLSLRAHGEVVLAVAGAPAAVTVDGEAVGGGGPVELRDGQVIKVGSPKRGLRTYVAVRGGFDAPRVLGSCSTDTLSGVGPPPIARGDHLAVGEVSTDSEGSVDAAHFAASAHSADPGGPGGSAGSAAPAAAAAAAVSSAPALWDLDAVEPLSLTVIPGPRDDWFASPSDLGVGEWVVSPHSNRVGVRLDRPQDADHADAPALRRNDSRELQSEGVTLGAIQVPPSGQPVLFLADHPVTGGYPVIGVVRSDEIDLAAQVRPGQRVRFRFPG